MEAKQHTLNNQQVTEDSKKEIKKIPRNKWQWKCDHSKLMGLSKNTFKRDVYSNTSLPENKRDVK